MRRFQLLGLKPEEFISCIWDPDLLLNGCKLDTKHRRIAQLILLTDCLLLAMFPALWVLKSCCDSALVLGARRAPARCSGASTVILLRDVKGPWQGHQRVD
jgi:hypothetical protein